MKSRRLLLVIALGLIMSALASLITAAPVVAATTGIITLSCSSGNVGTTVEVEGTGFTAGSSISSFTFGTANVLEDEVSIEEGEFSTSFEVPALPKNTYTITIKSTGGDSAASSFIITPKISLSASSGQSGNQIVISGNGFAASSKLNVYFDYSTTASITGSANAGGTFSGLAFTAPESISGSHNIKVVDSSGNSDTAAYTIKPKLNVNPVCIIPGSQVTFSGTGFASSSSIVITLDNSVKLTDGLSTDSKGTFQSGSITIPAISAGSHTFKASDNSGHYGTTTISTTSTLTMSPQSGPVGSPVTISGSGYGANEIISIYYGNSVVAASVTSDSTGYFKTVFNIPISVSGSYTISATDGANNASAKFITTVSASSDSQSCQVGDEIPVIGNGFTPRTAINIKYDSVALTTSQTDVNGSFATSIEVPPGTCGEHKVTVTDGVNSSSFYITVTSYASANVTRGHIGTTVTITGNAFTPGNSLTVKYDSDQVASTIIDSNGSFSVNFKIPISKSGNHTIAVTDDVNIDTFSFNLEPASPAAPILSYPVNAARADSPALFQWSPIVSLNGLATYELQVSPEADFSNPLIIKKGLTSNNYQTDEQENALLKSTGKDKPYYWRVRATDAAQDTSSWSMPFTFTVGFIMPFWLWYIIYGIGGLFLLAAGFFLGARFGHRISFLHPHDSEA